MDIIIETKRLILRTFTIDDGELILQLNSDPEVIRYTGDPVRDIEHARQILQQTILPQYVLYNHGRWAVHVKATMEFIGWCGLKARPERNEIDLGYRFKRSAWGQGYATESAYACLEFGFKQIGVPQIVGRAMPGNKRSLNVLKKCGMKYAGEEIVDGHFAQTYKLDNPYEL